MKLASKIVHLCTLIALSEAFAPATPYEQALVTRTALASGISDENGEAASSRRQVLSSLVGACVTLAAPLAANALDMDAFATAQVSPISAVHVLIYRR
jgi:hypothetical protein